MGMLSIFPVPPPSGRFQPENRRVAERPRSRDEDTKLDPDHIAIQPEARSYLPERETPPASDHHPEPVPQPKRTQPGLAWTVQALLERACRPPPEYGELLHHCPA